VRILVVSNLYPPNLIGGYERLCFDVTSELARRGHMMVVLTSGYGGEVANFPKQQVQRTLRLLVGETIYEPYPGGDAERAQVNVTNIEAALGLIRTVRPDVIFAWNLFFFDGSLFDALLRSGVRTVLMLTDNWLMVMRNPSFMTSFFDAHMFGDAPFSAPDPLADPPARSLVDRLLGRGSPLLASVPTICCATVFGSHFMKALYSAGGLRFREELVIHNGVRLTADPSNSFVDRSRLVRQGELRLLFAGRVTEIKGVHTALEALALLEANQLGVERVRFTILGDINDATYLARLRGIILRLALVSSVDFRPAIPEQLLFGLFQEHDIYLFPSLYEPFSLTLIHALAAGIPTVASRVGGNVEIVHEGKTGLLFAKSDAADLAHAITHLATDPALRVRVSAGAREVAASFTFDRMVDAIEDFLEGLECAPALPQLP
jgi:glycosyltransferase involved in cell wall biosynthesis